MQEAHEVKEGGWYCARCDELNDPYEVTPEERCEVCGDEVAWVDLAD